MKNVKWFYSVTENINLKMKLEKKITDEETIEE